MQDPLLEHETIRCRTGRFAGARAVGPLPRIHFEKEKQIVGKIFIVAKSCFEQVLDTIYRRTAHIDTQRLSYFIYYGVSGDSKSFHGRARALFTAR